MQDNRSLTWSSFFLDLVKLVKPNIWTLIAIIIGVLIFLERDYHYIKILMDSGYEQEVEEGHVIWKQFEK